MRISTFQNRLQYLSRSTTKVRNRECKSPMKQPMSLYLTPLLMRHHLRVWNWAAGNQCSRMARNLPNTCLKWKLKKVWIQKYRKSEKMDSLKKTNNLLHPRKPANQYKRKLTNSSLENLRSTLTRRIRCESIVGGLVTELTLNLTCNSVQ